MIVGRIESIRAHLDLLSIPRLWGKNCCCNGKDLQQMILLIDVRASKLQLMKIIVKSLYSILKKNQNAPRPSEHPPVRGENMSKRLVRWDQCCKIIQNLFMVPRWK